MKSVAELKRQNEAAAGRMAEAYAKIMTLEQQSQKFREY